MDEMVEKLSKLEQQQKELAEKIKREKAKIRKEQRERDKRRATLVGELVLANVGQAPEVKAWLDKLLDSKITEKRDRVLFGLDETPGDTVGTTGAANPYMASY